MRPVLFALAVAIGVVAPMLAPSLHVEPAVAAAPISQIGTLELFATEEAAQRHCRKDELFCLNTRTGIYHEKGMRWYGNTKEGAYVCRKEADAAGDRDTRNGQ